MKKEEMGTQAAGRSRVLYYKCLELVRGFSPQSSLRGLQSELLQSISESSDALALSHI